MAYSELIKSFARIRGYMREFYVYGFRHRTEIHAKSTRSYDNERRRIESWLGDYMYFGQDSDGKRMYLSVDSRTVPNNPLYKAFKTKSFTDNDVMLHFYLMDLLPKGEGYTIREVLRELEDVYLSDFDREPFDESTIRKKLNEYEQLGLVEKRRCGRETLYVKKKDSVNLESWKEAIAFYSETAPLGVVGSYLLDKYDETPKYYRFKHHYILHALDSEILCSLLEAISEHRRVKLTMHKAKETIKNIENTEDLENIKNIQDRKNTLYQRSLGGMSWIPVGVERKSVTMEITDDRNALERVLIHFSTLEKETKKISDRCYHVKLTYDVSNETEMLIRILSFGPVVKVLEPQDLITKIRERLERQKKLQMN